MSDGLFQQGETIECLHYTHRRDQKSSIKPGDHVVVLAVHNFDYNGEKCQDLMVQRENDMPISVLVQPGRFRKLDNTTIP